MLKCYFCRGETRVKKITVDFRWGEKLFVFENVPVEVCTHCGERYYSAQVSKKFDKLVKQSERSLASKKTIEVPVSTWQ